MPFAVVHGGPKELLFSQFNSLRLYDDLERQDVKTFSESKIGVSNFTTVKYSLH